MKLSDYKPIRVFHKSVLILDEVCDEDHVDNLYSEVINNGPRAYPFTPYNETYKQGLAGSLVSQIWRGKVPALNADNKTAGFEIWTNTLYNNGLHLHMDCDETTYVRNKIVRPPKWGSAFYLGPKNTIKGGELAICHKGFDFYVQKSEKLNSKKDSINGRVSHCLSDE